MIVPKPPGLWPARGEKRHVAVARDMTALRQRLDDIDAALVNMHGKLDSLVNAQLDNPKRHANVETRLTRVELLLFQTSLKDFEIWDEHLAAIIPKMVESNNGTKEHSIGFRHQMRPNYLLPPRFLVPAEPAMSVGACRTKTL